MWVVLQDHTLGLLFLGAAYTAIGIFTSTLTQNQIVAFIIAVMTCFLLYYGFDGVSEIIPAVDISFLGMQDHFSSISRGVIDTRDLVYFVSVIALFLVATQFNLQKANG